ncbi:MAG: site-specific DNA-methyltransferase [Candidatus Micrarchaeota archaeon]|nr:site-specific DNA-methyltransferase [Candidatus Micrarchaeota archaeon]
MGMEKKHLVVIGYPRRMAEVPNSSVQFVVTTPPYFDMGCCDECAECQEDFNDYLQEMQLVFSECHRVLEDGCNICVNICDVVNYKCKYPVPAHYTLLLQRAGFEYREDMVWRKPSGNLAGTRRGLFSHRPSPIDYSPSNILGHVLVFRKGDFNRKKVGNEEKRQAVFDIREVMRHRSQDMDANSAYPAELAETLIRLYTYEGETVLDPFLGGGMTVKAAACLGRRSIGYEPDRSRLPSILQGSRIAPNDLRIIGQRRLFE